ncbi:DUF7504 family protein [Halorussus sp. AFM4]|uniref:DUF7504 family protein n=1 Tax=Halorussus sp. AFM4 TaxID=3421651 RepID=UPI003EB7AE22
MKGVRDGPAAGAEPETKLVRTRVDADPHTLVLRRRRGDPAALSLLAEPLSAEEPTDALAVTHDDPESFLGAWRDRVDRAPRNVGVVSVGERMRSASASTPVDRSVVRGVADPADAAAIRDAVAGYLDAWPADGRTVAYVDSVTAFLDRWETDRAVGFLRGLLRAFDARDAAGYVCLTPSAHDCATVREVASLFDTVVECLEGAAEAVAAPSVSDCFEAVADPRRRSVLADLTDRGSAAVEDLTERAARRTGSDAGRVATALRHVHLPKLADFGVVAYDRERGRVEPGAHIDRIEPYLWGPTGDDAENDDPTSGGPMNGDAADGVTDATDAGDGASRAGTDAGRRSE